MTETDAPVQPAPLAPLVAEIAAGRAPGGHPKDAPLPAFPAAPLLTEPRTVEPGWIDYNGHMNVGYYSIAIDKMTDQIFDDVLLTGEAYARELRMGPYIVQQQIHYLDEMLEGERFRGTFRILDWDAKRMHSWVELVRERDGAVAATSEGMTVNVDLEARRTTPWPDWAQARIGALAAAQAALPRPDRAGAIIGIRRSR